MHKCAYLILCIIIHRFGWNIAQYINNSDLLNPKYWILDERRYFYMCVFSTMYFNVLVNMIKIFKVLKIKVWLYYFWIKNLIYFFMAHFLSFMQTIVRLSNGKGKKRIKNANISQLAEMLKIFYFWYCRKSILMKYIAKTIDWLTVWQQYLWDENSYFLKTRSWTSYTVSF